MLKICTIPEFAITVTEREFCEKNPSSKKLILVLRNQPHVLSIVSDCETNGNELSAHDDV